MTIRILHLEDDPLDSDLIGETLHAGIADLEIVRVEHRDEYLTGLLKHTPDLILADYRLPGFDGLAALGLAREIAPSVPFIFVSGTLGEETAVETLKQGAADYVLKQRLARLVPAVEAALAAARNREERKRAEQALRAQEQLLAALVDSLPDMIYAVDSDLKLTVVNRAMLEFLGRSESDVLGRPLKAFMPVDEARPGVPEDALLMATARSVSAREHSRLLPSGGRHWFVTSKALITSPEDGRVIGLVCVNRDVTRRKHMERELVEVSNREQRRIGADIHDGLGQELTGVSLLLKGLESRLESEPSSTLTQITKIRELAQRAIGTARSLARGLAPVELERDGLAAALGHLVRRSTETLRVECSLDSSVSGRIALDDDVATHLYRITQEAIANAAKHGRAKRVNVTLLCDDDRLNLEVADDGIGLPEVTDQRGEAGMGLSLMRYRATSIGGELRISPNRPTGTIVQCWCPLGDERPAV